MRFSRWIWVVTWCPVFSSNAFVSSYRQNDVSPHSHVLYYATKSGPQPTFSTGPFCPYPPLFLPSAMAFFRLFTLANVLSLLLDYVISTQGLGLPFLSPYLQSIGSDSTHGANFASSSSTVLEPITSFFVSGLSPFSLSIQLRQMEQFKARVDGFYRSGTQKMLLEICIGFYSIIIYSPTSLPFHARHRNKDIIWLFLRNENSFTRYIRKGHLHLYAQGGRTFMAFNLGPVGCYPGYLVELPHATSDFDEFGCMVSYNNAVNDYNKLLKDTLTQTRESLLDASLIYVDTYSALLELFHHPPYYGLKDGTRACCGHGGGDYNFDPKILCGNIIASACDEPQNYVGWDGIHFTEAANKIVALAILNGSPFDPPFPLHKHCELQPIG
ncbi:GDSL esterase/lipase [Spatholobus suberectus]|nr:GDSL esterase/lipase [Spatholobus suberectus]